MSYIIKITEVIEDTIVDNYDIKRNSLAEVYAYIKDEYGKNHIELKECPKIYIDHKDGCGNLYAKEVGFIVENEDENSLGDFWITVEMQIIRPVLLPDR